MSNGMLAIEDDSSVQVALEEVARELGLPFQTSNDGRKGLEAAQAEDFKVVVLDLGLPSIGGVEICKKLRAAKPFQPIVILTSRADELSRVLGLELGADDYVTKPFTLPELSARIRSILRRIEIYSKPENLSDDIVTVGDLTLNLRRREILKRGQPVDLSPTEFEVVAYLFANLGSVVSRDELIQNVWGYQCTGFDPTVTTYLSRIRRKLEDDPDAPRYVTTIRGVGYRFGDTSRQK